MKPKKTLARIGITKPQEVVDYPRSKPKGLFNEIELFEDFKKSKDNSPTTSSDNQGDKQKADEVISNDHSSSVLLDLKSEIERFENRMIELKNDKFVYDVYNELRIRLDQTQKIYKMIEEKYNTLIFKKSTGSYQAGYNIALLDFKQSILGEKDV